ncbi:hypothetical protein [Clostridium guangxiense]|uniref:hypothetical protein n=1 Tax=Clostridium guangxiense TaxID=1662055 RepID=UPI001E34E793|nr:hypothetical protein [Clostridium guangxiense]MCD2348304.1 hypothetical protein [Clostridium guangxiense]
MNNYKRSILIKASLILVLVLLMFSSGYEIYKLKGSSSSNQSRVGFQGMMPNSSGQNKNFNGGMSQGQSNNSQKQMSNGNSSSMPNGKSSSSSTQSTKAPSNWNGNKQRTPNFGGNQSGNRMPSNMRRGGNSQSNSYSVEVIIYSIIFIVSAISLFVMVIRNQIKDFEVSTKFLVPVLVLIALFLRLFIAVLLPEYSSDLNLFKSWAVSAANDLTKVYSSARNADYPPLYMYVLAIIGKIGGTSVFSSYFNLFLKLPSIFADILTSLIIYKLANKRLSRAMSIILAAFYLFNPAVLVNSSVWGQVDSFFTLLLVLAVFMLSEGKVGIASVFFTAAVLMKPQGIIFFPILLFELVRLKSVKEFVKAAFISLCTAVLIALPFVITNGFTWIFKLYSSTVGEYPYASVNGFNFFSLIGKNYVKDTGTILGISYHNLGMAAIVLITILAFVIYLKGNSKELAPAVAMLEISGVFTFASSMHERYLFPAAALSILAYIYLKDKRILTLIIGFNITIFSNTYYVLMQGIGRSNSTGYTPVLAVTSALNILLFVYCVKILVNISRNRGGVKVD